MKERKFDQSNPIPFMWQFHSRFHGLSARFSGVGSGVPATTALPFLGTTVAGGIPVGARCSAGARRVTHDHARLESTRRHSSFKMADPEDEVRPFRSHPLSAPSSVRVPRERGGSLDALLVPGGGAGDTERVSTDAERARGLVCRRGL